MKFSNCLLRQLRWINLPAFTLVALLQRTPVLRVLQGAANQLASAPFAQVLRAVFTVAALGELHSRAGATEFVVSPGNPINGAVGTPLQLAFTYTGTPSSPQSFRVTGSLPPGLSFSPALSGGIVNSGQPVVSGTPTQAGTFTISVQGFNSTGGGGLTNGEQQPITFNISSGTTATAPSFTTHPQNQTVNAGATVTFTSAASGSPSPTFQWRRNGADISGATNSSLTLNAVTVADAGTYSIVATNSAGSVTSNNAVLTVNTISTGTAPTIGSHPQSLTVNGGGIVALAVVATGSPTPTYQWRKNGTPVAGATDAILRLNNVGAGDAATYSVTVANSAGSVTSNGATLTVTSGQSSRLANLSVRTNLGAGENLIVGFGTSGEKTILLRAVGPTLGADPFGIAGVHPDPSITVFSGNTSIAQANDWNGNLAPVFPTVGAFPLVLNSKDAAFQQTVNGSYTAHITGPGSGLLLVEVYDTGGAAGARLGNVSARNIVGSGADILIAGFFIAGDAAKTLLIRGVGQQLAVLGVPGVLSDPKLEIFSAATGAKVVENDSWALGLKSIFESVAAFALTDGSKDSALIITLPPGGYTAQLSGVGGVTGDGIIEVYELP